MGIKVEKLADRAIETIQDEINGMSKDDLFTFDHERFIHETIDMLMPTANWEIISFVSTEEGSTDLGFSSDVHMLENHDNIFTFLLGRIFEEVENIVRSQTQEWFEINEDIESNSFPDDNFDDGWALASAGFGTDEDFGFASDILQGMYKDLLDVDDSSDDQQKKTQSQH